MLLKPSKHSAKGVAKAPISLYGEVDIVIHFDGMDLPLEALVVENLDCGILAGTPFGKVNDVEVSLRKEIITMWRHQVD